MLERTGRPKNTKRTPEDKRGGNRHGDKDLNETAFSIVQQATGQAPKADPKIPEPKPVKEKNAAAVTLGRLGGLKGGKARAEKLTPEQRAEIAKKAAGKRWGKDAG